MILFYLLFTHISGRNRTRYVNGRKQGEYASYEIFRQLAATAVNGVITEELQLFTHSRGASFGNGYISGVITGVKKYANCYNLKLKNPDVVEYSINMATHQFSSLVFYLTNYININISHNGDLLSSADSKGNVTNILSLSSSSSESGHRNVTFVQELGVAIDILHNNKDRNKVIQKFKEFYKVYDNQFNSNQGFNTNKINTIIKKGQ